MSRLLVLDGLDGSGKETQTKILEKKLAKKNIKAMSISCPNYKSPSCSLVEEYLLGNFWPDIYKANPYAVSSFYACDRFINYDLNWKKYFLDGYFIIADRYVSSNAIYQLAKLKKDEWQNFLDWLYEYEYEKLGLPKEDMLIYLDLKPQYCSNLLRSRNKKSDLHENNLEYLAKCRRAALFVAKKFGWQVVKCYDEDGVLSLEAISKKIEEIVFRVFFKVNI